jgi:hypothetical protein
MPSGAVHPTFIAEVRLRSRSRSGYTGGNLRHAIARRHFEFRVQLASKSRLSSAAVVEVKPIAAFDQGVDRAGLHAFESMMPMFSGGNAQKRLEAAFLRVVKAVIERLCRVGELLQCGRARRKACGALL